MAKEIPDNQKNLERIYPELNLEKWAIWQPASSRSKVKSRTLEREISLPDGSRIRANVEIGSTDKGSLTTEDQKVYYALIKIWEDNGKSTEQVYFSLRQLARTLKKKWGATILESLSQSLFRLRFTPFIWRNSYYDSTTKETIKILKTFTILSELETAEKEKDGSVNKEAAFFQFYDLITKNLVNKYSKPYFFDVVIAFKSEIAQMLYRHLDLMLADKTLYERKTRDLFFEDLRLEGEYYKKPAARKRVLERALKELRGIKLSSGVLSSATIQKTKDGKDYKLIFRKSQHTSLSISIGETKNEEQSRRKTLIKIPSTTKNQIYLQAMEIVNHFYNIFHGLSKSRPSSKEVNQATTLIGQHGFDLAKYIVEFSYRTAPQTNYKPQTFGGILQYESKAITEYKRIEEERQKRLTQKEADQLQEEEVRTQMETRLKALPQDQYRTLYEKIKAELLSNMSWLKERQESSMFESIIKEEMIKVLDRR